MDLGISGKTALVLGGGGGLGGAIARALAREGAKIAVADINRDAAANTVASIASADGTAIPVEWDLGDLNMIAQNLATVHANLGPIDILVNITGGPPPTPIVGQPESVWRKQFEGMVLSVIALGDALVPEMRERKWGRVITSTSSGVVAPIPNLGISNALRMSLLGWSKTLAREVARDGVTSNVVVPGRIATNRITFLDEQKAKREGKEVAAVVGESISSIPAGRYGTPEEYADTVAFLASDRASYITGSVIRVDGGLIQSV